MRRCSRTSCGLQHLTVTADGGWLASGGDDGRVVVWKAASTQEVL